MVPFVVKDGPREKKAYGLMITCLVEALSKTYIMVDDMESCKADEPATAEKPIATKP